MVGTYITIALSFIMGFSVFLSMPIIFSRRLSASHMLFLNAAAIGILVFLLMDIYGDVAGIFGNQTIASPMLLLFLVGFVLSFLFFILPKASRDPEEDPKRTSVLAAIAIGFQNLTEGMLFGSAGAAGLVPIYTLSLVAFTLQNFTEGFPIAAPLLGHKQFAERRFIAGAFALGGVPTIIGTVIGVVFFSNYFIVFFDALASAAIIYVVLVLFHVNMGKIATVATDRAQRRSYTTLVYIGVLVGIVLAFVLNYAVAY